MITVFICHMELSFLYKLFLENPSSDEKDSIHTDEVSRNLEKASKTVQNESPSRKRDLRNTLSRDSKVLVWLFTFLYFLIISISSSLRISYYSI